MRSQFHVVPSRATVQARFSLRGGERVSEIRPVVYGIETDDASTPNLDTSHIFDVQPNASGSRVDTLLRRALRANAYGIPEPPTDVSHGRTYTRREIALLNAFATTFLTQGFRRVAIEQLASDHHCSRRTIYNLAASKDSLVVLVLDRQLRRHRTEAELTSNSAAGHIEKVRSYTRTLNLGLSSRTEAFTADLVSHESVNRLFQEHYRYTRATCAALIRDGVAAGELAPIFPDLVAESIFTLMNRLQTPAVRNRTGLTVEETIDTALDLVLTGCLPRSKQARPPAGSAP